MLVYKNGEYVDVEDNTPDFPKEVIIEQLKAQLKASDYKAIKYAEGWISEEDYAPIKSERQAIRD